MNDTCQQNKDTYELRLPRVKYTPRIGRGRADNAVIIPQASLGEEIYEAVSDILDDPRDLGCQKIYMELQQAIIEIMRKNDWILKSDAHDYCNSNQ
jgi:hypothetical protein